ncbi:hypothetical protein RhiTH_003966 [Rhizoctonia solani]
MAAENPTAIETGECNTPMGAQLGTKKFRACKATKTIQGNEFKFIDSPGFGNEVLDDREILESLVRYFAPDPAKSRHDNPKLLDRVTGILYIHPEDKHFSYRSSPKTIEMLQKIIGEQLISRITVLIQPKDGIRVDVSSYTPRADSPLLPLYRSDAKPRTMIYDDSRQAINQIMDYYTKKDPRFTRLAALDNFAEGGNWRYDDIPRHLKEWFPEEIGHHGDISRLHRLLREHGTRLDQQQTLLSQKEKEIFDLRSSQDAEKTKLEHIQNVVVQRDAEIRNLQSTRLAYAKQEEFERLKHLLAQKEEALKSLQSVRDNEQANFRNERTRENFNHGVALKRLENMVEERNLEISRLKSTNVLELERIQAMKTEEINRVGSQIAEFEAKLEAKDKGLTELENLSKESDRLSAEKDLKIKRLQEQLNEKCEEIETLKKSRKHDNREGSETVVVHANTNGTDTYSGSKATKEVEQISTELHRVRTEYASLRGSMQVQENTEPGDITTAIGDINRLIEELGNSLSERIERHMEESHSEKKFQQQDLLSCFSQSGGETNSKANQDPYVLLEYAVQATVCTQLYTHLFTPFHPSISGDEIRDTFIRKLYDQVAFQQPQPVAGRWRKDAFNALSNGSGLEGQDAPSHERVHQLTMGALATLLEKFIDTQPHKILNESDKSLAKIIAKAEELNRLLKGGVSQLGDFQPILFSFGEQFNPDHMSTNSTKSKKTKPPERILATIEMGLTKKVALGRGQKPEETVLRRAVVFGLGK